MFNQSEINTRRSPLQIPESAWFPDRRLLSLKEHDCARVVSKGRIIRLLLEFFKFLSCSQILVVFIIIQYMVLPS